MKNKIKQLKNLIGQITEDWIREYFELPLSDEISYTWIEKASVFEFADYYISFQTVLDCYELGVSKEKFFKWYNNTISQETELSLSDFILSPEKRLKKEQKYLQDLKERVIFAEETFKKALEEYENNKD